MGNAYFFAGVGILISTWLTTVSTQGQHLSTPPAPYAVTVQQPDGTTLQIIAKGNDFNHWSETLDGYTVLKNEADQYVYAEQRNDNLVASNLIAQDPAKRTLLEQRRLLAIPRHLKPQSVEEALHQKIIPLGNARMAQADELSSMPTQGKLKVLAICIDYPDLPATYDAKSFLPMFNGPSDKPSFKEYFLENSYGALDITVDVVGWVRAENNYEYYGEENGKERARTLVAEAISAADGVGVDFSEYDNNGDGSVDGLIIIHAGPGAEEGRRVEYIWSHRWSGVNEYYDGQQVSDYIIAPEIRRENKKVGIGIFCHEFGHLLGLPDLYDTGPNVSEGIGEWGLMGFGGFVGEEHYPAGMTAWSKEVLGWADVIDITDQYGKYQLKAASTENEFYKIRTGKSKEYFLLENRQTTGMDSRLKGSGLAIWHINQEVTYPYFYSVLVNANVSRKGVDLEEADGRDDLDNQNNRGDAGDLYPGSSNRQAFNYQSSPSSNAYAPVNDPEKTGISLENIREENQIIQFTYRKDLPNIGQDCSLPAIALVGDNEVKSSARWYVFTMPEAGSLNISSQSDNRKVFIYKDCGSQAAATAQEDNIRSVDRFVEGQQVLIHWETTNPKDTFSWTLSVEDIIKTKPVITAAAVPNKTYGDNDFLLDIKASENLPVELTIEKGDITLSGNKVSMKGAGEVRIKATRAEDDRFLAADPYYITFNVEKANQSIVLEAIADVTYQPGKTIPLQFTTSTNLPVSLKVVKGKVSIQNKVALIEQAGSVSIQASQPESKNYRATTATWEFEVLKAPQSISLAAIDDKLRTDSPFALEATSDADLPLSFRVIRGAASVKDNILSLLGSGEVVVEAYNAGNANYQPASAQREFLVNEPDKKDQDIVVNGLPDTVQVGESIDITVLVSSNLNPTIQVTQGATRSGNTITFVQTGEVTIQVAQPGNSEYNAAATFTKKVVVTEQPVAKPLSQELVFEITGQAFGNKPISLNATATSGLPVTYKVVEGKATIKDDTLLVVDEVGTITVEAYQAGGDRYSAATRRTTFEVTKGSQAISSFDVIEIANNVYKLQATASSGLPVFFEIQKGEATINNDTLIATTEGPITVVASQPGNVNFFAAEPQAKLLEAQVITDIENEPAESVVSIYPNPSPQTFQVTLPTVIAPVHYRVVNAQGVIVQQGTFLQMNNEVDLARFAEGAYVLHLQTSAGSQYYRLLKE